MIEQHQTALHIIRTNEARASFGLAKSSFYDRVKKGLITPPISLGGRAKGYIASEIEAVLKAMVSGKSEKELKAFVNELVKQRKNIL